MCATIIKKLDPDIPVLIITAFGNLETAVEAMKEGACYFIAKPFDREHLLLAVEKILGRRCLAEEAQGLRIPGKDVERGIVCVFPHSGGSMRLRGEDAACERVQSPEGPEGPENLHDLPQDIPGWMEIPVSPP